MNNNPLIPMTIFSKLKPSFQKQHIDAVNVIEKALKEKVIYNPEYNKAKTIFNYGINVYFRRSIHQYEEFYQDINKNQALSDLYYHSMSGFSFVMSGAKKARKVLEQSENSYARQYLDLCLELMPLVETMNELKPYIVLGRRPSGKVPVNKNTNKIVKTCSCCFREIAIDKNGRIVHHGYKRSFAGFQTTSCFGQGYPSWETSPQGLIDFIKNLESHIVFNQEKLLQIEEKTEYKIKLRETKEIVVVKKGSEKFENQKRFEISNTNDKIKELENMIEHYSKILKERKV